MYINCASTSLCLMLMVKRAWSTFKPDQYANGAGCSLWMVLHWDTGDGHSYIYHGHSHNTTQIPYVVHKYQNVPFGWWVHSLPAHTNAYTSKTTLARDHQRGTAPCLLLGRQQICGEHFVTKIKECCTYNCSDYFPDIFNMFNGEIIFFVFQ